MEQSSGEYDPGTYETRNYDHLLQNVVRAGSIVCISANAMRIMNEMPAW